MEAKLLKVLKDLSLSNQWHNYGAWGQDVLCPRQKTAPSQRPQFENLQRVAGISGWAVGAPAKKKKSVAS
jgi:hypothetical protein